jgi:hypothetical protein
MEKRIIFMLGALTGVIYGTAVKSPRGELRPVQREEGLPAIMVLDRVGRDGIFVQRGESSYVDSIKYLSTIPNKADREIERYSILKAAGFYQD